MNGRPPSLSVVPDPPVAEAGDAGAGPGAGGVLDLAVISDRIGWEEKAIMSAARDRGARVEWLDDGRLCCGQRADVPRAGAYLIRSRSFVRGPLIAASIADDDDRVVNRAEAIDLCSNKVSALAAVRRAGLPTVPYRLVLTRHDVPAAAEAYGLPLVLKPVYGGLGRRVLLLRDLDVADSLYDYVEHYGQGFDRALIAQPYLDGASDVRVLAVDGEPLAAIERVPGGDWRANVELGAEAVPIELEAAVSELTASVGRLTGAAIFALDLFRHDGQLLIGEVNHSPMFRGIAEATGIDVGEHIAAHLLERVAV